MSLCQVFIHQSIKPRVETQSTILMVAISWLSLSINPLNQGLKRFGCSIVSPSGTGLYPSIH